MIVDTLDRRDRIVVAPRVSAEYQVTVDGSLGDDRIRAYRGPGSHELIIFGSFGDDWIEVTDTDRNATLGVEVSGGGGNDVIRSFGAWPYDLDCGPGQDLVRAARRYDGKSCERFRGLP